MKRKLHRSEAVQICNERDVSTSEQLALRYGVDTDTINAIWTGKRWKELNHPNQGMRSKPRLNEDQNNHLKSLCGQISPQEAAQYFNISVKRVLAVWREKGKM